MACSSDNGTATWTASPQMLWKDQTSAHYFLGVYPKREITNFTADTTAGEATAIRPAVTATGDAAAISLPSITANSGYALSYQSIMVPQSGFTTIAITIDGKDYTFTNTADIALASGMTTTVNLIVGRTEITLGEVSINGWTDGTTINGGEAQTD